MTLAFNAHRSLAVVQAEGKVVVSNLPLRTGETVEVIVLPLENGSARLAPEQIRTKLRGSILRDDDPFGPATPPEDWEALR